MIFLQKILRHARMCIQTDHGVARRRAQRDVDAAGQPALRVFQQLHLERRARGKATHDLRGVVRGGAVHQQRFQLFGRDRLREQVAQQRVEALRGVVSHDDKTDFCHTAVSRLIIPPHRRGCARDRSSAPAAARRKTISAI